MWYCISIQDEDEDDEDEDNCIAGPSFNLEIEDHVAESDSQPVNRQKIETIWHPATDQSKVMLE